MEDMTAANAGFQGADVGRLSSLFYAAEGAIGSLDPEWLQRANQHLCNLFRDCTSLAPNTEKTETMNCHPRVIQDQCSEAGYKCRHKGTGETYSKRKGKGLCVHVQVAVRLLQLAPYNLTYICNME